MRGEADLPTLLRSLGPVVDDELYTFATVSEDQPPNLITPLGLFREAEGMSIICSTKEAETLGLTHEGQFRKITFSIHSSLATVGLTARVSAALAARGIPCNIVAAFYHDHLFVPADRAADALEILSALA